MNKISEEQRALTQSALDIHVLFSDNRIIPCLKILLWRVQFGINVRELQKMDVQIRIVCPLQF